MKMLYDNSFPPYELKYALTAVGKTAAESGQTDICPQNRRIKMKDYLDYAMFCPMTDGKEICSFLDDDHDNDDEKEVKADEQKRHS